MNFYNYAYGCGKLLRLPGLFNRMEHKIYSTFCFKYKHLITPENCKLKLCHSQYSIDRHFSNTKLVNITPQTKDGIFKSFIKKVGWLDISRARLRLGGYLLYESITDRLDYGYWINENELSNSFMSWFLITELHVWLLLVRCMSEGNEGRFLRNSIIEALWSDVSERSKKLCPRNSTLVKKQINILSEEFQAALMGYDEGLMSDDIVLAGAVWRRFYSMNTDDALKVENLVRYIRKQMLLLESIPSSEYLDRPKIEWVPLKENQ